VKVPGIEGSTENVPPLRGLGVPEIGDQALACLATEMPSLRDFNG